MLIPAWDCQKGWPYSPVPTTGKLAVYLELDLLPAGLESLGKLPDLSEPASSSVPTGRFSWYSCDLVLSIFPLMFLAMSRKWVILYIQIEVQRGKVTPSEFHCS